jgi:hypothetical protein
MLYSFARPITNIIGLFLIFLGLTLIFFFQPAHAATKESQIESLTNQLVTSDKKSELELKEIARKRKELLSDAAKNDPELFLKLARLQDKTDLPESVKADLEKTVEADGELMVIHFDNPTHPKTEYKLLRNKKLLNLHFVKEPKNVKTGTKVKLKTVGIGDELVLPAATDTGATQFQTQNVALSPMTDRTVAVLLVNFANDTSTPTTSDQINSVLFTDPKSVTAYYKENSYNQLHLSGQTFGWFTLTQPNTSCDANFWNWTAEADTLAQAAGVPLANFSQIVYVFPTPTDCPYGGLGTIGGEPGRSWIFNYYSDNRAFAHELGHNLGLYHAHSLACNGTTIDNYSNCTQDEYGDYYDVMGNFWFVSPQLLHFNAAHKIAAGWIPDSSIESLTKTTTVKIYSEEVATSSAQVIKVKKPDTNEAYYISYRRPTGFDAGLLSTLTRGASIHIGELDSPIDTNFLDASPLTATFDDGTLQDGQTVTDPINGISFTQVSHNAKLASIKVTIPDTTPPTVAITYPTNGGAVPVNTSVSVTADATDDIKVTKVQFRRNGSLVCTDSAAPYSCLMKTGAMNASITYQAQAYDAVGHTTTSQVTVTAH